MTSCKLILRNVRKNMRDYLVYFLTLMISVSMFYAFNSLSDQAAFSDLSATKALLYEQLDRLIGLLSVAIAVVLAFLIVYANQFLLKRRKKELGIYMMSGMKKGRISRLFAGETLCVGFFSLATGLILGLFFSQGVSLLSIQLFAADLSDYRFVLSGEALRQTVLCFAVIFFLVMIFNVRTVSFVKLIDLLSAERKNETSVKWNKTFGKHAFDFTGLLNWEQRKYWSSTGENSAFQPSDLLGFHGMGFGTSPVLGANDTYRTGSALMARLHYAYDNRYMITATVRRDGYSAFGQENPYAVFPSVALGWVFSEEKFMKNISWLEYGKLRLSWGQNGNRSIGEYAALMRLEPRKYFYYDPLTGEIIQANSFYSYNMANSSLKWENTESWNIGIDFTLLNGRLGGSIDVYTKKTNNLLNDRKLPDLIGYASVTSNIGEVNNKGVEISLRSTNIQRENFEWSTTFNLAYNKNTIKHLYGLMENVLDEEGNIIGQKEADDISKGYFIGHALDEKWGYKFLGVWQENEAEEAAKYNQVPGDPKLLDVDQNYKYNNDDKVFLGNTTPKVRWNMRNEFTLFKNWNFSFSMYSYLGHIKTMDRFTNSNALLNVTNSIVREYWTPENPINEYPRLKAQAPVSYSIYKNASFLRFDNISLGYSFPKAMIQRLKIQALSLNLTLKNVGVISGWPAYDPENSDANTPRTLLFGLNMTL